MRRTFKCRFNIYITQDNREGVLASILSQFQGYNCDPEITLLDDDNFAISVNIDDVITPTLVRDKLVFNYFIDGVSSSDTIRAVRKMVLPRNHATVVNGEEMTQQHLDMNGVLDSSLPEGANNKAIKQLLHGSKEKEEDTVEDGERDLSGLLSGAGVIVSSWVKTADPATDEVARVWTNSPDVTRTDLPLDINDVTASVVTSFGEGDSGGSSFSLMPSPGQTKVETPIVVAPQGTGPTGPAKRGRGTSTVPFDALVSAVGADRLGPASTISVSDGGQLGMPAKTMSKATPDASIVPVGKGGTELPFNELMGLDGSWGTQPVTGSRLDYIYLGLADEHPYDDYNDQ